MTEEILEQIKIYTREENILINENMSKHTSFKIGGPAEIFIKIQTPEELKHIINVSKSNDIPLHIIGNGSNILVKDEGIKGIVCKLNFKDITIEKQENTAIVKVGAGVPLGMLAQKLLKEEITGFEFASGIPGTIGGAIRMNAGAYDKEMKDIVVETKYMNSKGEIKVISNKEHEFTYRNSIFGKQKYIILETSLKLEYGDKEKIKSQIEEYTKARNEKQPIEYPNAGSTFKRGEDFITAKLIDECGLKGYKIGGAQVSEKHAGFVINAGNATAQDVIDLTEFIKETVYKQKGKKIELEIEILG